MLRSKEFMSEETFIKAISLVKDCVRKYGQKELNLCGIGESTMHPQFVDFVRIAREALPHIFLVIASNGVNVKEEYLKACADYGVAVYISLHRPEVAAEAVNNARKYGVLAGVSSDAALHAIDWAGQVKWRVTTEMHTPCPWLQEQRVMVTANGDLTTCCLDGDGLGIIGNVDSDIELIQVKPYSLCKSCHHSVPEVF